MFRNTDTIYQITGEERKELETLVRQLASVQGAVNGLLQHIMVRENIPVVPTVRFDIKAMAFLKTKPEPAEKAA